MKRMWINQPSTLQPYHGWHGCNVLVDFEKDGGEPVAYFLFGDLVSMQVSPLALSEGWLKEPAKTYKWHDGKAEVTSGAS